MLGIVARANARIESHETLKDPNFNRVDYCNAAGIKPEEEAASRDQSACDVKYRTSDISSSSALSSIPDKYEWTKLDDFAKWMQASDENRQRQEKRSAEQRVRADLDKQVLDIRTRKERERRENLEYSKNMSIEIEKWKDYDRRVTDERRRRAELEKLDRDEQLQYDQQRKLENETKRRQEDQLLLERIEIELKKEEQEGIERKKRDRLLTQELMRENEEDRLMKLELKKQQDADELKQLHEYHAVVEKQEQEREIALARRVERQKLLIKRMEENVTRMIQEKSNDDNVRALKQQAERDARAIEIERFKERKLAELTNDMKRTLDKQTQEKETRKREDSELKEIHARILQLDTEQFRSSEAERLQLRRKLVTKYRQQLDSQVAGMKKREQLDRDEMSRDEILLNRELIELVETVLPQKQTPVTAK